MGVRQLNWSSKVVFTWGLKSFGEDLGNAKLPGLWFVVAVRQCPPPKEWRSPTTLAGVKDIQSCGDCHPNISFVCCIYTKELLYIARAYGISQGHGSDTKSIPMVEFLQDWADNDVDYNLWLNFIRFPCWPLNVNERSKEFVPNLNQVDMAPWANAWWPGLLVIFKSLIVGVLGCGLVVPYSKSTCEWDLHHWSSLNPDIDLWGGIEVVPEPTCFLDRWFGSLSFFKGKLIGWSGPATFETISCFHAHGLNWSNFSLPNLG